MNNSGSRQEEYGEILTKGKRDIDTNEKLLVAGRNNNENVLFGCHIGQMNFISGGLLG